MPAQATNGAPDDQQGFATGLVTMSQQVGTALGTPVMSAIAIACAAQTLLTHLQADIGVTAAIAIAMAALIAVILPLSQVGGSDMDVEPAGEGRQINLR